MRTLLKGCALLLAVAVIGAIAASMKTAPPRGSPAECADPAACEEANKVARANTARTEREMAVDVLALRALKASMHDPASFEVVRALRVEDGSLCVTYRAKNGFNALRLERAVIAPKASAMEGDARFLGLWNGHCGGKSGTDITHIRHAL
jgi:hypothetical protein